MRGADMKVTKGNISKALIAANISKSVVSRGRVCSGVTEGFEYIEESEFSISVGYAKRSSSYQKYEIWSPIKEAKIQKIAQVLVEAGFKVESKESYVEVSK
jgi:hypothetical protein